MGVVFRIWKQFVRSLLIVSTSQISACTGTGDVSPVVRLEGARDAYARDALASAAEAFVAGPARESSVRQAVSLAAPTLGPEIFDTDSTVPLSHRISRSAEVGVVYQSPKRSVGGATLHVEGEASIGRIDSTYLLPDGIGILADPMTIAFRSTTLTPTVRLVYDHPIGGRASSTSAFGYVGLGRQFAKTTTKVSSALIAITDKSSTSQNFGVVGAGIKGKWLGPNGPDARLSASTSVTVGQGMWTTVGLELTR